ncbi:mechanosensitive ion channel family protein [Neolewinella antarctica]|uniref:Small-conductance mechanosensitive channel n=1 Tax=Neolewinella antarctica TaxID=442734 RepID=A0ABX0XF95_9BACT|nr:mechanosensitive ion channel domain-containing protein [Neolewinella antarctica]NJC27422.1 small-conductance mechanosensitive channel [Neolewinella antarctica]
MLEELYEIGIALRVRLLEFLPQATMALIVLIIGYVLARLIEMLVIRSLRHTGRLVSRRFVQLNLSQYATVIGLIVFWFVILLTFLLVSDILKFTLITVGIKSLLQYLPNLLAAGFTVLLAYILGKFLANLVASVGTKVGVSYGLTLGRIIQYGIVIIGVIIAIDQIGIEIAFFINIINIILAALLFGAALAFGLGARTSISNILATFYVRKMYKEGDEIRIGDLEGKITKIDTTAVVLETKLGQCNVPAKAFNESTSLLLKKTES